MTGPIHLSAGQYIPPIYRKQVCMNTASDADVRRRRRSSRENHPRIHGIIFSVAGDRDPLIGARARGHPSLSFPPFHSFKLNDASLSPGKKLCVCLWPVRRHVDDAAPWQDDTCQPELATVHRAMLAAYCQMHAVSLSCSTLTRNMRRES
jgi:hypothetical protein